MEKRKRKLLGLTVMFIGIFILSSLSLPLQNVLGETMQDDEDLEATLHCRLVTDSSELQSELMPIGTYTFYDQPSLDTTNSEHELTTIDINRLQYPITNTSTPKNLNFTNVLGNHSYNSTEISEYELDAPKDTTIKTLINYTYAYGQDNVSSINATSGSTSGNMSNLNGIDGHSYNISAPLNKSKAFNGSKEISYWDSGCRDMKRFENASGTFYVGVDKTHLHMPIGVPNQNYLKIKIYNSTGDQIRYNETMWTDEYGSLVRHYDNDTLVAVGEDYFYLYVEYISDPADLWRVNRTSLTFEQIATSPHETGDAIDYDIKGMIYSNVVSPSLIFLNDANTNGGTITYNITADNAEWHPFNATYRGLNGLDIEDQERTQNNTNVFSIEDTNTIRVFEKENDIITNVSYIINLANDTEAGDVCIIHLDTTYNKYNFLFKPQVNCEMVNISVALYYPPINVSFRFDLTNKTAINNLYYLTLVYNSSNTDNLNLQAKNGGSWYALGELNSSSTTTKVFRFQIDNKPEEIRILWDNEEAYETYEAFEEPYIYIEKMNLTANYKPFESIWVQDFIYQKLGLNYTENFELIEDTNSYHVKTNTTGNFSFYFDSTQFSQYSYLQDLVIPTQNLTLIFNVSFAMNLNTTLQISYSTNTWQVPTEVALTINSETVIDETYNSGYTSLDTYPNPNLEITADQDVYFETNITVDFTLSFNLDVISKTYLKKAFKLTSNHEIIIDRIDLPSNLDIKKIYINNYDLGYTNPNYLSPGYEMIQGNQYTLEVILAEVIYLPLTNIQNTLGTGTATFYMEAISNPIVYNNLNRFDSITLNIPSGFNTRYANLSFSDLQHNPYYTSNTSNDLHSSYATSRPWGEEGVSWSENYYHSVQSAYHVAESGGSGFETIYSQDFSSEVGTHAYYPDAYNSSYNFSSDDLYMENQFPQEWHNQTFENYTILVEEFNNDDDWDLSGTIRVQGGQLETYDSSTSNNYATYNKDILRLNNLWAIADSVNITFHSAGECGSLAYAKAYLQVYDDGDWSTLWSHTGYESGGWNDVYSVDAGEYINKDFNIRFLLYNKKYNFGGFDYYYNAWVNSINITVSYGGFGTNSLNLSSSLPTGSNTTLPSSFTTYNGSLDSTGNLGSVDGDYYTFNSTEAGRYPATYSFENEEGETGTDIDLVDSEDIITNGGTLEVQSEKLGHKDVIYANPITDWDHFQNTFSSQTSGTIEFWVLAGQSNIKNVFSIRGDSASAAMGFLLANDGNFKYYNGVLTTIGSYNADQWYHVKFEFDCSTDTISVWIDGVLEAEDVAFTNAQTYIDTFRYNAHNDGDSEPEIWIDAIGYSWDSEYNVGDNLNMTAPTLNCTTSIQISNSYNTIEQLALYYSHMTDILQEVNFSIWNFNTESWVLVNSSVNNQSFYEMVKNDFTLLDILNSTNHIRLQYVAVNLSSEFQLYIDKLNCTCNWTTTSGDIYSTINKDIDYTFLNRYDIGFDEYQKLYNITIKFDYKFTRDLNYSTFHYFNNSYLADYSFFEELGLTETSIGFIDASDGDGNCEASIIAEKDAHNKVLDFYDNNNAGQGIWYNVISDQTSGVIEFYIYFEDTATGETIELVDDGSILVELIFDDDGNLYYDGGSGDIEICPYTANKWHRITINFSQPQDDFDLFMDGEIKARDISLKGSTNDGIDQFYILSDVSSSNYHFYMDAIDYSWENEWQYFSYNFEFNSTSLDAFNLFFNISNGLLELRDMNYTLKFKCLDNSNRVALGQYYSLDLPLSLDYLQQTRGNFILNYTLIFNPTGDTFYNFYNQVNSSYLLVRIAATHEDGSNYIYNYNTNSSVDQVFSLNITDLLASLGKSQLKDLVFKIAMCGNPSNLTLDNMTLFDFDSEFYQVQICNISDNLVVSEQNFTLSWKASDRYISYVEINLTYNGNTDMIYNVSLTNNTLDSRSYYNCTTGTYYLNFTFYDMYGNWERWALNYTVIGISSISTSYQTPVFVNNNNSIFAFIESEYAIINIYYDNSTDYLTEYSNSSYPLYEYEFNFSISYDVYTCYNLSVAVLTEYNDTFYVNISGLYFIERSTFLNFDGLKQSYQQDDSMLVSITLNDVFLESISSEDLNYNIQAPNGTYIVNSSSITNGTGKINITLNFSISYDPGFYHLNVSYNGSSSYMRAWKMDSFEITPIVRSVNSSEINLKVNNNSVLDNFIQINHTSSLNITCEDNSTFDLSIVLNLNYSESISYANYLDYEFEFAATSSISYISPAVANLSNIPTNFTNYYYNDLDTSNYTLLGNNLQITALLDQTLYDERDFEISLRYLGESTYREQLTGNPRTDSNSVLFREQLLANRTFSYWYFRNERTINSVSLNHLRTGSTISNSAFFTNNSKYYFEKSCLGDDLFNATIDYNPNWSISYEIQKNNGTYSRIKVQYSASLEIENVSIILDLEDNALYNENWTLSGTQNVNNFKLEIPNVNFTSTEQTLYIEGFSSIPLVSISDYESDQNYNAITVDEEIDFAGFLDYPKFTKIWRLNISSSWDTYKVYYGDEKYSPESLSSRLIEVEGEGFDPSITNSYLHFSLTPFSTVDFDYNEKTNMITIEIVSSLNVENCEFIYKFDLEQAHNLILIENDTNIYSLSDSELEGYLYFKVHEIPQGTTIIRIYVNLATAGEMLIQSIFLFSIGGGFIIAYYYLKNNEEKREKLKDWLNKKVIEKISKRKDEREIDKLVISTNKKGKLVIENQD